jgi:hypothetical protein
MTPEDVIIYKLQHGNLRFEGRNELVKYIPILCELGFITLSLSNAQPSHFDEKYTSTSVRLRAATDYDNIGYRSSTLLSMAWILVPFDIIIHQHELEKVTPFLK